MKQSSFLLWLVSLVLAVFVARKRKAVIVRYEVEEPDVIKGFAVPETDPLFRSVVSIVQDEELEALIASVDTLPAGVSREWLAGRADALVELKKRLIKAREDAVRVRERSEDT